MLVPPGANSSARPRWRPSSAVVLPIAALIGIFALGWFSVLTRPTAAISEVWWPASGLALGLGIRTPRNGLLPAAGAVVLVLLGVNLAQYPSTPLAVAASVGAGVEMVLGTLILRAGADAARLETYSDLATLLFAVFAAATAYDLTLAAATLATGDVQTAALELYSAGPRRAAGMLLVTPLFMRLPRWGATTRPLLNVGQIAAAVVVSVIIFTSNDDLPLSFLALVPPAVGALAMAPRWLLVELLGIAGIASYGSATGHGPFSFARFGPTMGSTLLQAFELTMVTIVLLIALTVVRERTVGANLAASEQLYRRNFETSLAGMLVAARDGDRWQVQRANAAASALFPALEDGPRDLTALIGEEAVARITESVEAPQAPAALEVHAEDGRSFQMGVVPLELTAGPGTIAVQLLDVTDSRRAQRQAAEEFERAGIVQRALTPARLPSRAGWEHGASAVPARYVGGDFYDLRIEGRHAVMTLGDVMGKGIGAGILAAAARTALKADNAGTRPVDVIADSARIIDDELRRTDAFVTLGYATVDLLTGHVRLADAGHGLSFVLRDAGTTIERLATDDLPVGIGNDWTEIGTVLAPGDSLLMVSDGVLDRWGSSVPELMDAIRSVRADPAVTGPQELTQALCRRADPESALDDATAVMIHRVTHSPGGRS